MPRLSIVALLIFVLSCGQNNQNQVDNFSSPKNQFVDYVTSFTGDVVSITDGIKLRLTRQVPDSLVGTAIVDFFSFSPSLSGASYWSDNQTIVFEPDENLDSDQQYRVTADLTKVFEGLESDKREFKFMFRTLVQNFEARIDGLKLYENSDFTKVKVEGRIQTADFAEFEAIQKILAAEQNGSTLELNWEDTGADNIFKFTIENVAKSDEESSVTISLNGSPIGVDKRETMTVSVPSIDSYKVLSSRIVEEADNYISVLFSDPIDADQNLRGLVTLSGTSSVPRLVVSLNELKVYPTEEVQSEMTLVIDQAVRNSAGVQLGEDYMTTFRFAQVKPEVRLVNADEKSILPNTEGLILPFEAVGLNAVDVTVIEIFEENVLQFLQVNGLGGERELRRVARPIKRKTVPLNTSGVTDLNQWNRYSLNLDDILTARPGSIYQVRIGFRKRHSLYYCSDGGNSQLLENLEDDWGAEDESSYWDFYDNYYNPYFNWQERDNPCSDSYYGNRRSVSKMLFASNLGLIAKRRDGGKLHVYATNLVDTEPLSGVSLGVYDYQQQLIAEGTTGEQGLAQVAITKGTPFVLVARQGSQKGYLKLDDGSSLSLSNFNVTGTTVQRGLKGFIYGERGVWRPADTVHLGFILQDVDGTLPEDHPVVMEVYNPSGQIAYRKISTQSSLGVYRFDFATDSEAPTGNWQATAKVGGATFYKTVKIETIKPNRLKVDLTFDKERFSANDNYVSADLDVRWLTGATARGLKVEYEMMLVPMKTSFDDFPNHSFDDISKRFYSEREMVYEGKLNDEGQARINFDLGSADDAPGALRANFYGRVYEEGGDFSIRNTRVPYYPYTSFVGLKAPEGDRRGMLLTDQDHAIQIATVDADGNPVSRSGIRVELYKVGWRWWWDQSYDNISNYVGRSYNSPEETGRVNTVNGKGTWTLNVKYPEWGRYFLRVEDPVSGHSSGQIIYMDWPGWAGKGKRGELGGAAMLDFSVEGESYEVGQPINLSVPSTAGTRILVSLESGSEVLQNFWVTGQAENTPISFKATPEMAPNVYAHLTMIQPHGQTTNDLPIRLYGVQSIKVVDPTTTLTPEISMPTELRPEQQFTVKVTEANKKAMGYTVAIVDEGLLDITNFDTPDPWSVFYAREALGIKTWDIYDDVIGAFGGSIDHLLAIGGDGEIDPQEQKEANRFKPVVKFLGPFVLKAGETNSHTIKMPQYIGSVKTMVVAANDRAFGKADVTTPVVQPLMVQATFPRVAGPGEQIKLPVNLFVLDESIRDVSVKVETSGMLTVAAGKDSKRVQFRSAGDELISFDLEAKQGFGIGKIKVTATGGGVTSNYDIELNVIPRNPRSVDVVDQVIAGGESWNLNYEPLGTLGENAGYLELSTLPSLNLEQRLQFLIRYPHGCLEQTTSAVFAQVFLDELMDLSTERKDKIQSNIDRAINRLQRFQVSNGGFAYWPGNAYASNWGTNYAGHFLLEARKAGYAVPQSMMNNWKSFQTQKANAWGTLSTQEDDDLIQAYRLYTLALAGSPALGAMNRMKEGGNLSRSAKWRLALAYAVGGYDSQALLLIQGLETDVEEGLNYRYSFGSRTRDRAMILETLTTLDRQAEAFPILMDIAEEMGDGNRWMSTQTTAYSLIAISKYAASFGSDKATNAHVTIGSETSNISGESFIHQIILDEADAQANVSINNKGEGPIFARLIRSGIPIEGTEQAAERNIGLSLRYTDMQGRPLNVKNLKQGTNFKAIATIRNPGLRGEYNELALTQVFPAGWEIINTRLDGSATTNDLVDYLDIRDDRTMHYFDLGPNREGQFEVMLNAAYQGRYYLPSVQVEAMYDNGIFASKEGQWVEVVK